MGFDIDATARRYIAVHGDIAWLAVSLIADRHYSSGAMGLFRFWVSVAERVNDLLPAPWREELH